MYQTRFCFLFEKEKFNCHQVVIDRNNRRKVSLSSKVVKRHYYRFMHQIDGRNRTAGDNEVSVHSACNFTKREQVNKTILDSLWIIKTTVHSPKNSMMEISSIWIV